MEPISGDESKVEHTLYCRIGAPSAARLAKAPGNASSIHCGLRPRDEPARPTQRTSGKRANSSGVGVSRHSSVATPAAVIASIASVEPVKSSP